MATKSTFANPRLTAVVLAASMVASSAGCAVAPGATGADTGAQQVDGPEGAVDGKNGTTALNPKAVKAQAPTHATTTSGFSFGSFLFGLAEHMVGGLLDKGLEAALFGEEVDYERIDQMMKDDLKEFGEQSTLTKANDDILATTKTLRTLAAGRDSNTVPGRDTQDIRTLNDMWPALDKNLTSISREEDIRRPGFKTYLFGATVQHSVFQELRVSDPKYADKYDGELRAALQEHLKYVRGEIAILDKAHKERFDKVGPCVVYHDPIIGDDSNHYFYFDRGADDDKRLFTPKDGDFEGQTDWGQPHYFGVEKGSGEDTYRRVWWTYNVTPAARTRCDIAHENYLRDMGDKMREREPVDEARGLVAEWQKTLDELDRRALKPVTPPPIEPLAPEQRH